MMMPQTGSGRGIAFMLATMIVFAVQDGISRYLAGSYPPIFIVMIRYWAFLAFVLAISSFQSGGVVGALRTRHPVLQMARGLLLALQICAVTFSFAQLGLGETHAILAINPLVVVAGGALLLSERVSVAQWLAVAVGFVGITILVGPTGDVFDPLALIPLVCAFGFAGYQLLTKWVGRSDPPQTSFFYTGLGGAITMTIIGPFFWTEMLPEDWAFMAALCVTGACGHFLLIKAYEAADASVLQPYAYVQLMLTSLIGVVIFSEVLTPNLIVGAGIIVGAGLFAWTMRRA
ncbi:MAG: DMT family transporter [Pseudomonadota bacterium]